MNGTRGYLLRRSWQLVPTMAGVVLLVFFLFNWVGGDPAQVLAGKISNPEEIANIRRQLGVDRPYHEQLLIFARQIVTMDFGRSWSTRETVRDILVSRAGPSLTVMIPIMVLETAFGILFALCAAYFRGSLTDRAIMVSCTLGMSVSFLVYIIAGQYLFGFVLGWFPVLGWSNSTITNLVRYSPLPVLLAVAVGLAPTIRLYRSVFLEEIGNDYVRTARAKGLGERAVMLRHVLRNAMIPILTNISFYLPGLVLGSFLLERFFSIPGLGREVILAVDRSDFPVIKAVTVYLGFATVLFNLLVDLLYRWVDPRVELQ